MATVTGFTATRMQDIEDNTIVDGNIVDGNLILEKHDGSELDIGVVEGPQGDQGDPGEPGEGGCVYKNQITTITHTLLQRQVAAAQAVGTATVLLTGLSMPTVVGRRYRYSLSGVVQFSAAPDIAHIKVLHGGVAHTTLYHGYSGLASSFHDVNRMGQSWVASAAPTTSVSLQIQRPTGAGSVTLDPVLGDILFELYDVGSLA